jgi:hypothetical protein
VRQGPGCRSPGIRRGGRNVRIAQERRTVAEQAPGALVQDFDPRAPHVDRMRLLRTDAASGCGEDDAGKDKLVKHLMISKQGPFARGGA